MDRESLKSPENMQLAAITVPGTLPCLSFPPYAPTLDKIHWQLAELGEEKCKVEKQRRGKQARCPSRLPRGSSPGFNGGKDLLVGQVWRFDEYVGCDVLLTKPSRSSEAIGQMISKIKQSREITQGQRKTTLAERHFKGLQSHRELCCLCND